MSDNKKIAKNSLFLYVRLVISTLIGLYTSKVILHELGVEDFGLYAVVGGGVALMNIMGTTIMTTSSRFLAVEIGIKVKNESNDIFNKILVLHIVFGLLLILLSETIGVWFVLNRLNIASEKIQDALFVLRISILTSFFSTISMPYQSLLGILEKFNIKVVIEIVSSFLNLMAAIFLIIYSGNKLIAFSSTILIVQLLASIAYFCYCRYWHFEIIKFRFNNVIKEYKSIARYFGWQMLYVAGAVGYRQGSVILLNLFFGPALNASFSIASRVNEFIFSFVKNLNQAAVPQIMKSYSGGNYDRSLELIYNLSKYTFFFMLIPGIPIIITIDSILFFWLGQVPKYTSLFVVLNFIAGFLSSLISSFDPTIDASGNIRKSKFYFTVLFLTILPISYFLFKLNTPPYTILILELFTTVFFSIIQIRILTSLIHFNFRDYFKITLVPVGLVSLLIFPQLLLRLVIEESLLNMLITLIISLLLTTSTVFFVGLNKNEKIILQKNLKIFFISIGVFSKSKA